MQIKELKAEGLNHEFEITIPANDIDARVNGQLEEVGKTYKIPGFRPGKVPMNILKQKLGRAVMGEVLEKAVDETSRKALDDKKLRPAMQPKIEVKSFDDGADLVYSMAVEVLPEIKIAEFKDKKFTKPVAKPDDKAVDDALERIAANNATTKPIEGKRAAKDGDTVVISFDGRTADDDVKQPGMQSDTHHLKLGSGAFIPGFEGQLVGKKASDDVVEVKVTFPEEYGAKELAGRDAIFDVVIKEIHEDATAEINDEFAKTLGMDDVKALKEAVSDQLSNELEQQSKIVLKKDILDFLDDKHKFEIPGGMLDMESQNILDQVKLDKQRQGEKDEISKAEEKEYREIADRRVRLGLVLAEIGNQQKITISDMELQKSVITEAQKYPGQEKEVFDYYSKNPQALESLRAPLYEEKVVDYIVELCEITEKKVTPEDLFKILEEDDADEKPKAKKTSAKKSDDKKSSSSAKATDDKATKKKPAAKKKS